MEAIMDREVVAEITSLYEALSTLVPLHAIRDANDYELAVNVMNCLLDAGAANEKHPLAELVHTLGLLIGDYDEEFYAPEPASPVAILRLLMEQHHLSQSDLTEVGTQGVVSEVLSGKRELNVRQIKALAERFKVPAAIFIS